MRRTIQRALILVFASGAVALAVNAVRSDINQHGRSNHLPLRAAPAPALKPEEVVSLDEAIRLWDSGTLFLDARNPADYTAGHIANAVNLPLLKFDEYFPKAQPLLTPDSPAVVYCDGADCDLSQDLARRLRELGFKKVRLLVNGWTQWHHAGLPIQTGTEP